MESHPYSYGTKLTGLILHLFFTVVLTIAGFFWINLYLLADMADVYCHCFIRSDRILIPDTLINLVDGKYFSLILHQQ